MSDLFTGPWKKGDKGPAIMALKRAVSRINPADFPWAKFDEVFNERLRVAISKIQAAHKISPATGNVGRPTYTLLRGMKRLGHPLEAAFDAPAITLLEDAYAIAHPPVSPETKVRQAMTDYCVDMENHNAIWHYRQARPMKTLGVPPERGGYSDCSEFATCTYWWARKVTGIAVPDPNGRAYDGWGNTDTIWAVNRGHIVSGNYEVGDLALYGLSSKTDHVTVCRSAGDTGSAVFTSNGSEAGPLPCRVNYRTDFLAVVRPKLVP